MTNAETGACFAQNLLPAHRSFYDDGVSLNGKWRFLHLTGNQSPPEGWLLPEFQDRHWDRINVPGSWEAGEYCPPRPSDFPAPEKDENIVGLYRRSFILSRDQGSRQILLRFGQVSAMLHLWVNGEFIGMAKNSRTVLEFDITRAVRPEKNQICVMVFRYSDVTALEQPGRWLPSGILGDVQLYTLPRKQITAIQTFVRWTSSTEPELKLKLTIGDSEGFTARIALMDDSGVIGYCESEIRDGQATALIPCNQVRLWSAETPVLYRVAVILWDGVAMYHTRQISIGFRSARLENGHLMINGTPETIRGMAYSPMESETGCLVALEQMERDLNLIRSHHFNSIFVTGMIPDALPDLCDRIGLYLIHHVGLVEAFSHQDYLNQLAEQFRDITTGHPCLLISNLAEPDDGIIPFSSLNTPDGAALQITIDTDLPGELSGCGGIFGTLRQREFMGSPLPGTRKGFLNSDGTPSPELKKAKAQFQPFRCTYEHEMLTVENRSTFLRADAYQIRCILTRDGQPILEKPLELNIGPGESLRIPLETKYDIYKPGRYHLSIQFLRKGEAEPAAFCQWPLAHLKHIYDENPGGTIREDDGTILLRSKNVAYGISRGTGAIEQIRMDDRALLLQPISPVYTAGTESAKRLLIADDWEKLTQRKKKLKPSVLEVDHMTRTVTASFHLGSGLMHTYRLFSDGSLSVELRLRTGRTAPERIGLELLLPAEFHRMSWFGLGPDNAGASRYFAVHNQAISGSPERKESVYNLTLSDGDGNGLRVRSEEGLWIEAEACEAGIRLLLELMTEEPPKPHTTYLLSFTLHPEQA